MHTFIIHINAYTYIHIYIELQIDTHMYICTNCLHICISCWCRQYSRVGAIFARRGRVSGGGGPDSTCERPRDRAVVCGVSRRPRA